MKNTEVIPTKSRILVASRNKGKLREINRLIAGLPIEVLSLDAFEEIIDPEETGSTFRENALLKARYYAKLTGEISLSDDSGLEVTALDNKPGIYSARYGGANASYQNKIDKLLRALSQKPVSDRSARFVCALALVDADQKILFEAEGICEGTIQSSPRGEGGFGYDPIFVPIGFDKTFGEIDEGAKDRISHRGIALEKLISFLRDFSASSLDEVKFSPVESAV